jgi:outer membrane protein insertion porin family
MDLFRVYQESGRQFVKKRLVVSLLAAGLGLPAWALQSFVISDIQVEGLQRIAAGTVFNYLPLKVGDRIDDTGAQDAIKALFKTGFFKDVRLRQDGTTLVVEVEERPSIAGIKIIGNSEIPDDALQKVLRDVGLVEGRIYDSAVLDRLVQELKTQYLNLGKYAVEVKPTVTPLERNRVDLTVEIQEGETAKIKRINIVGNEKFTEDKLRKQLSLSTGGLFSYFTKSDRYSKQKLAADLETLKSFYHDQGYLDFNIESTQVTISPDKEGIFITAAVREGERYTVTGYEFAGKLPVPEEELRKLIKIKPGEVYSRKKITGASKAISDRLSNEGYAFASVNATPQVDKEKREAKFTFFVDPGRLVTVRRVNITGNSVTQDDVIRRELRQLEGATFSAEKMQRSKVRLQRLGFFEDITIDTPAVPGSPDQVDVNVTVKEKSTGSLLFGVGYSDSDGFLVQASVSQRNLFGSGKELTLTLDNSAVTDVYFIEYTNPYFTQDGISAGLNAFYRSVDTDEANTAEYIVNSYGTGFDFRIPVTEYNSLSAGLGYEKVDLEATAETPPEIRIQILQQPTSDLYKGTGAFAIDTRDSILYTMRGMLHRISGEVTIPGSDLEYWKASYAAGFWLPLSEWWAFKVSGEYGQGDGYGDTTDELPFFKNFFAGGASTVRGYQSRSLGPRDSGLTPEPLGGDRRVLVNAGLLIPFPGSTDKDKRLELFVDGGQVWGPAQNLDLGDMRYAAGLAFNWFSILGPLSISYAIPINKQTGDEEERLQITLGRFFR